MLVIIALFATLGFAASAILLVIVFRGYRVFLSHMLMVLYRIAIGEVAAIELIDDEE